LLLLLSRNGLSSSNGLGLLNGSRLLFVVVLVLVLVVLLLLFLLLLLRWELFCGIRTFCVDWLWLRLRPPRLDGELEEFGEIIEEWLLLLLEDEFGGF